MRSIRWKSRYLQGDSEIDRRNKKLVGCFNQLLETAGQREHCQEMEQFLTQVGTDLEGYLQPDNTGNELADKNFYTNMLQSLPLSPYGTMACRKCGLCDIAQAKIAQHLQEPLACLEEFSSGPKVD